MPGGIAGHDTQRHDGYGEGLLKSSARWRTGRTVFARPVHYHDWCEGDQTKAKVTAAWCSKLGWVGVSDGFDVWEAETMNDLATIASILAAVSVNSTAAAKVAGIRCQASRPPGGTFRLRSVQAGSPTED